MRDDDDLTQARLQHGDLAAMRADHGEGLAGLVALTLVIGVLVAGSAIFAKNHPRALAACVTNCE